MTLEGRGCPKMAMVKAIEYDDLQFGKEQLGAGGSATVYKGIWKSMDMIVAVKTSVQGIPDSELEIMSLVDHPNLLHFYGAVLQPPLYCIVTEHVEQGALFDFLHQNEFDSNRNLQWAREIAAGMKYLHFDVPNRVVIHGDLKSKNVLVAADNTIKICDFGSSKLRDQLPGISVHTTTKVLGTPRWMAPEVLECKSISKQCDVYSYGIVVWELLTHKIPFEDITDFFQICKKVTTDQQRPPIPLYCSPILADLLTRFWHPNPKLRPEFTDIVSDMEHLPQMIVGKELSSQLQNTPLTFSAEVQHLQVPLQRPIPQPRSPRPVPRPRTPQSKAQPELHPSPQTLELSPPPKGSESGLPKTPPVPRPRSFTTLTETNAKQEPTQKQRGKTISTESDAMPEFPPRPRSNAMSAAIPRPNRTTTPENGEVTPLAMNFSLGESLPMNEEAEFHRESYSDDESHDIYEDPQQDLLSLQPEAPAESDSLNLYSDVHPIWAISREEVELLDDELGKGAWGVVRKARFRGEIVAAKRLHETLSQENTEFLYKGIRRELDIASNLRHPNLVLFLGAVIEGDLTELIILNEFMDCSLRDVLAEGQLSRSQIKSLSFDVARALNYLHSCKPQPLIHRDVSSSNVLLQRLGPDYWKAKVSDYGSLQAINLACTIAPGNPVYAAPEAKGIGQQSCKMDTYSFGILLIEMLTCQLPIVQQRVRLLQEVKWQEMHLLIEVCIQDNPEERPTMQDIIKSLENLPEKSPVQQPIDNYVEMRWFVPSITRIEAENKLAAEGKEGSFLVRISTTKGSKYSLTLCHYGKVYHYRIWQNKSSEFSVDDNIHFQSLEELVEFYKKSQGGLCTKLCEYTPTRPGGVTHQTSLTDEVWEIPKSELICGSEIAKGQCGYVVTGVWKGTSVAVRITKQDILDGAGLQFLGDAISVLKEFQHESLVKFHGICSKQGPLLIVTELMPRGSLDKYIKQHQELLERNEILMDMATQICSALKFLENKGITHGDLAARNCLVGESNVVKVADYSLALYTSPRKPSRTVVSIRWAAPELIVQQPVFTTKSDVWSFGIIMWELWSGGQTPYLNLRNPEVKGKLLDGHRLEKPGNCPDEVYTLMRNCWKPVDQQRPSFAYLHEELCSFAAREEFGELQNPTTRQGSTRKRSSTERFYYEGLETPKSELTLGSQLGNGGCGYIVAGRWRGIDVSIRITKEKAMNKDVLRFIDEAINTLKEFQHENLMKLYGICSQGPELHIITEMLSRGRLNEYLHGHRVLVEKTEVLLDMATQVCSAMKFLETKGIVHKDVAARNCLVGDRNVIKLADNSLPLFTSERTTSPNCVPIRWVAPEILKGGQFSIKSDIWSFGILLWELWTAAELPYAGLRNQQVTDRVIAGHRLEKPQHCPQRVYELMRSCWMADAEQRTSFAVLCDGFRALSTPDDIFGVPTGFKKSLTKPAPKHSSIAVLYDSALEIHKSQLKFGRELTSGKYGYMMSGEWKGKEVAIRVANDNALTEEGLEFIEEAISAMKKFAHPNLLQLHGLCTREGALYVVTELIQLQGNLLTYLRQHQQLMGNEEVLLDLATQICSAMQFLETNGIIHRDLAARNCLIGPNDVVKVTDFSLPIFTSDRKPAKTCFPIKWSAPEVITEDILSAKSVVWSYGILLWEMWSGGMVPYPDFKLQQSVDQVLAGYRLQKPQNCSQEVYNLMQRCWQTKPEDRPTFVVLHGELTDLNDEGQEEIYDDCVGYDPAEEMTDLYEELPSPTEIPDYLVFNPVSKNESHQRKEEKKLNLEREKKQEKEMKRREEARLKTRRRGLKSYKQFGLPSDVQPLFSVEVLLDYPKTKDHLSVKMGEKLFVILISHPKLPDGEYLVEKEDGTIGYVKKAITQREALHSTQNEEPPPLPTLPPPNSSGYRRYTAMYDYEAADVDEVSFVEGDIIVDGSIVDVGWMEGRVQRTGKKGLIPSNYVKRLTS